MAAMSKFFEENVKHLSCSELVHPNSRCIVNAISNLIPYFISNCKFYMPILVTGILMKIRRLNKEECKETLNYYMNGVLVGTLTGIIVQNTLCLLRNLLGEFKYCSILFIPSLIGSLSYWFANSRTKSLFTITIMQCIIESFMIRRKNSFTKIIAVSRAAQTLVFMCNSALILHAKQIKLLDSFWILKPNSTQRTAPEKEVGESSDSEMSSTACACEHELDCKTFLLSGMRNHMAIGFGLDIIKMILSTTPPRLRSQGLLPRVLAKIGNFRLGSTALLTTYVGIYRAVQCYLNRKYRNTLTLNHLLAGFLSGSSFIFYPKLALLSYAIAINSRALILYLQTRETSEKTPVLNFIKQLPMFAIIFSFGLAYLVHVAVFKGEYISHLGHHMINMTTNHTASSISKVLNDKKRLLKAV